MTEKHTLQRIVDKELDWIEELFQLVEKSMPNEEDAADMRQSLAHLRKARTGFYRGLAIVQSLNLEGQPRESTE